MVRAKGFPRLRIRLPSGIVRFFELPRNAHGIDYIDHHGYRYYIGLGLEVFLGVLHEVYGDKIYHGFTDRETIRASINLNTNIYDMADIVRRVIGVNSWHNLLTLSMITGYYVEKLVERNNKTYYMGAGRRGDGERMRVYSFKAPPMLMERLYRLAEKQGISIGEAIRRAIAQYILAHEPHLLGLLMSI